MQNKTVDLYYIVKKLPDRNGKHGEGFVHGLCAGFGMDSRDQC